MFWPRDERGRGREGGREGDGGGGGSGGGYYYDEGVTVAMIGLVGDEDVMESACDPIQNRFVLATHCTYVIVIDAEVIENTNHGVDRLIEGCDGLQEAVRSP
ncbi:hypothetical protein E2C01_051439 [Portunus trituberculatus]|uniref:Uncharacterized protein n=1 Tax=Portunus trituberculatus TaxID=210409 RepID=A0A5B7GIW7_PORTR|nr:hypothetical protein [Portunus trituberculatus]